jgi:FkbH-like protein
MATTACLPEIIESAAAAGTWLAYRAAARKIRALSAGGEPALKHSVKLAVLGSATLEPLLDYVVVEAAAAGICVESFLGGYGSFEQDILDGSSGLCAFQPEMTLLVAESAALGLSPQSNHDMDASDRAVEQFLSVAEAYKAAVTGTLVVATFLAPPAWPFHIIPDAFAAVLRDANGKLLRAFADDMRVQVCDIDALATYFGYREALSPEMLHMASSPFSESFLVALAKRVLSHIKAQKGLSRKCLVLDCDQTLWGGIVGEDGCDGIRLGPDWPGREFVDFQRAVLDLHGQGAILAINSKNNRDDVLIVLREHPHMVLREEHFAAIEANWDDKPSNMRRIAASLNIGIDSMVFIDDNPAERALMRDALPAVCTLELPPSPSLYARAVRETNEFASAYLTQEDKDRGKLYAAQRQREQLRDPQAGAPPMSLDDFLKSLEMRATIRLALPQDVKRAAQLTQRTNQFNLTTRRYTEAEIADMLRVERHRVFVLALADKFGDSGTVGLAIAGPRGEQWWIDAFLLSCRVIGRRVEEAMLDAVLQDAARAGAAFVCAEYIATAKNGQVADFWQRMEFQAVEANENRSVWRLDVAARRPLELPFLRIENGA